jgi:hypothetical protein
MTGQNFQPLLQSGIVSLLRLAAPLWWMRPLEQGDLTILDKICIAKT